MTKLVVAKFGGSAIGPDGISIPIIVDRINNLKKDSKVIAVFSAPLTIFEGQKRSLTDVVLEQGRNAENGTSVSLEVVKSSYQKILPVDLTQAIVNFEEVRSVLCGTKFEQYLSSTDHGDPC